MAHLTRLSERFGRPGAVLLGGLVAALLAPTCKPPAPVEPTLTMTDTLVEPGERRPNGKPRLMDDRALFAEGETLYRARQYRAAHARFATLVERLPDSRLRPSAAYNAGLCLRRLGRHEEALGQFDLAVTLFVPPAERRDAAFMAGMALIRLGRLAEARERFEALLGEPLTPVEQVDVLARAAYSALRLGDPLAAETRAREVVELIAKAPELRVAPARGPAALAHHVLGQVFRGRFSEHSLRWPMEQLERDLQAKGVLFLAAQSHFLDAVRTQHRHWSVAAGVGLGRLYEEFHAQLLATAPPEGLGAEDLDEYLAHLRTRVRPLVEKALLAYEQSYALAERLGAGGRRLARLQEAVQRLRAALTEPGRTPPESPLPAAGRPLSGSAPATP